MIQLAMKTLTFLALGMMLFGMTVSGFAAESSGGEYPLDVCPVAGEKLGARNTRTIVEHEGREIHFCCTGCAAKFEQQKDEVLAKVDQLIIEQQSAHYPLETCVVSDDQLGGDMGEPIKRVYKNRLVKLCCRGCIGEFEKNPESFVSKLDEAVIARDGTNYPLETCVVSGQKLGSMGTPVDKVFAGRLVRLCCNGCISAFKANPHQHLAKMDAAKGASQ